MVNVNPVQEKSFVLAIEIVALYKLLQNKKEFVMSKQLLKSGTSIGANIEEALQGQSRPDFIAKLSIAHKEAFETNYWMRLLIATDYLSELESDKTLSLLREVLALLTSILKTAKKASK